MTESVTITILRTVRPGQEEAFEQRLREFIPQALSFPGHLGVHVLKPTPNTTREYRVVIRFATRARYTEFQSWPPLLHFQQEIAPLLERDPCLEELTGLESWFTLPGDTRLHPLPRWKMALVTVLGVYPTSLLLGQLVMPLLPGWPGWLQSLVMAVLMVVGLTWVVMPLLTWLLRRWLHPESMAASPKEIPA